MILSVLVIGSLAAFLLFTLLARMIQKSAIKVYKSGLQSHEFIADNLMSTENIKGSINFIYEINSDTNQFIERYVISTYNKEKILILKFNNLENDCILRIHLFNKHKAYIGSYLYKETTDKGYSSDIKLPSKCLYVQIEDVDKEANKTTNNFDHRAKRIKKEQISLLQTYAFFSLLLPVAYALIYIVDKEHINTFFNVANAILLVILMVVFTMINFMVISKKYTKKTAKVGEVL